METRERIALAAARALREHGAAAFTVGTVAEFAAVSSALVHYHFATKHQLLCAAAGLLAREREDARLASFDGVGMTALDAAWSAVRKDVASGTAGAWFDLARLAAFTPEVREPVTRERDRAVRALAVRLPLVLQSLTAAVQGPADELAMAVAAELDGLALALLAGARPAAVRTAFDGFWLVLIAGSQAPGPP